jgi:hypothetical protein
MSLINSEVCLSINLQGQQAIRGSFVHFRKVDEKGNDVRGIKTERPTSFCVSKKSVRLSNEFVRGALFEPPTNLKHKIGFNRWKHLPEAKRIMFHVKEYIKATHPENRGYTVSII